MRKEETQVSRLLSIQVCNIPLSLIPFSDIEEVKKNRMSVLVLQCNSVICSTVINDLFKNFLSSLGLRMVFDK